MPDAGYTPPTPLATQLATATPDANGHILLTLKRRQYVLQSGDSHIQHDTPLIALRPPLNDGLDDDIIEDIRGIIGEWELINQIGCLVSDHASNNDIYAKALYMGLNSGFGQQSALDRRLHRYGQISMILGGRFCTATNLKPSKRRQKCSDAKLCQFAPKVGKN
ncbi:hypothetical protein E4U14_006661 [Claviceps sp. LM454 group G7]|nr:hypothetical protein E4U14_006661 [Claviceps sp. LM454 group G7]